MTRSIAPALAILMIAGGCKIQGPRAAVTAVEILETTSEGATVMVTVTMENRENIELPLPAAQYDVSIEGLGQFSFQDIPGVSLPPAGTQTLLLPAAFATKNGVEGRQYTISGQVSYRPPGAIRTVLTDYRVPLPTADFSTGGQFD